MPVGGFHIIAGEGAIEKRPDAIFVTLRREEDDSGLAGADRKLDPALVSHRLVGDDAKPHLVRPEAERTILILDRNAGEFQMRDHGGPSRSVTQLCSIAAILRKACYPYYSAWRYRSRMPGRSRRTKSASGEPTETATKFHGISLRPQSSRP